MTRFDVARKSLNHLNYSLSKNQKTQRVMSTGRRTASFKEDMGASGMSVRFNARHVSLKQAIRNVNKGLRAATQTDEGLQHVSELLTRMRELSVQASNGVLSSEQRMLVQQEFFEVRQELDRFSESYSYNDELNLLSNNALIQIGFVIDTSGSMYGEIDNVRSAILNGTSSFAQLLSGIDYNGEFALSVMSGDHDGAFTTVDFPNSPNFSDSLAQLPYPYARSGMDPFAAIAEVLGVPNNRSSSYGPAVDDFGYSESAPLKVMIIVTDTGRESDQLDAPSIPVENSNALAQLLQDNNVTLYVMGGNSGMYSSMANQTGGTYQTLASNGSNASGRLDTIFNLVEQQAQRRNIGRRVPIQAGDDAHDSVRHVLEGFTVPAQLQINNLDLSTTDGAREAIGTIDFAFGLLDTQRAEIAASTNRLLSEQTSLMTEAVDLKSAATVIEDADMAEEMVKNTNEKMAIMSSTSVMKSWFQMESKRIEGLLK